jgi:predicted outer membrane repeat protein
MACKLRHGKDSDMGSWEVREAGSQDRAPPSPPPPPLITVHRSLLNNSAAVNGGALSITAVDVANIYDTVLPEPAKGQGVK